MRKIITSVLGLALLVVAFLGAKSLMSGKPQAAAAPRKNITAVFTDTVQNSNIPIVITSSGSLVARNKVDLFAEVQGIFEKSAHLYRPGSFYRKGELLLRINSDEHRANLKAQKSNLYNQIVLTLPDLKLDYPEAFGKWEAYVHNFDMEAPLAPLPEPADEREKLFISGRNFFTLWYTVKNLEERLIKFEIRAPFSGILTMASVNPGTLVRPGQKLGEFLNSSVYELELPVNVSYLDLLKVGKTVELHDLDNNKRWKGRVARINGTVNTTSQMVLVYIEVSGKDLREGMFLEAELEAKAEQNAYEIDRKLLQEGNKVFLVQDTVLTLADVEPVFYKEKSVVVKGLEDGTVILAKPVPGAFNGMRVRRVEEGVERRE
ncbi:MAG: HlyD family efflux transporter periplasmic adaptor subunit [Bacteroidetes bacterium]|nr:MAG: HlyD family efflux transporter periplasmic adaptor subunit [Bacteroidota bacterium]